MPELRSVRRRVLWPLGGKSRRRLLLRDCPPVLLDAWRGRVGTQSVRGRLGRGDVLGARSAPSLADRRTTQPYEKIEDKREEP